MNELITTVELRNTEYGIYGLLLHRVAREFLYDFDLVHVKTVLGDRVIVVALDRGSLPKGSGYLGHALVKMTGYTYAEAMEINSRELWDGCVIPEFLK